MDDFYRPLGHDRQHPAPGARRHVPRARHAATAVAILALLGVSAAFCLTQPAYRQVDALAEARAKRQAETAAAARTRLAAEAPPPAPARTHAQAPVPRFDPEGRPLPSITYPPGMAPSGGERIAVADAGSVRQKPSLAALPDESLLEPSAFGALPVRASDGRRPFDVYSVPPESGLGTRVAIVVGGLGISQTGTQGAIAKLPAGVTLAFSPAGNSLDRWMRAARGAGHELMLQAPMEPVGYPSVDPGPHTLMAADAAAGRLDALAWSLGRLTNYVGVMNYMGARVTADPAAVGPVMEALGRRGLMYLDDASAPQSRAADAAREAGAVFATADILLDADQSPEAIARQLDTLERVARAKGTAIGVASAFDASVGAIDAWATAAQRRGIEIVPVSSLANDPEAR